MLVERKGRNHVLRGLLGAAAFVIVVAGMRAARPVLVPLLVAAFVSLVCVPAVNGLRRRRVPNGLAVAIVVVGMVGVVSAIGAIVGSSLSEFVQALPGYQARLDARTAALFDWLQRRGLPIADREAFLDAIEPGYAFGLVATLLNQVRTLLTNGVLVLLVVVFILLEVGSFRYKLRQAIGAPKATFPPVAAFMDGMKRYFVIKTSVSLVTGTLVAVWLSVLGVDFPLLWGLIAFLFNYVPNIGSIIASIPAALLALVQLGLWPAFLVVAGYLAINMVMGNFLEPRWMGHGVGLSPLVVFFSLIAWGWVLGPVGLLLSVPLTMTVKIAAESSPETRWLAVLLGPEDVPPDEDAPGAPAPELEEAGVDTATLDAAAERAQAETA